MHEHSSRVKGSALVAVRDTANMLAATFEPFYRPALIAPGGDVSFSAQFKAE